MTTKEAVDFWGVKVRQVQTLCERGLIEGATKRSDVWLMLKSAAKPIDRRTKTARQAKEQSKKT
ncbi:MAG: hypothetical protein LBJ14_10680 [Desulfarculales bacterium]|jgi:hypothetical protein|nr:hypothetical protein [Desulfarculales bacterium]